MWKVEYKLYDRVTNNYSIVRKFFNSKRDALDYYNSVKYLNTEVNIEDLCPVDGDLYK